MIEEPVIIDDIFSSELLSKLLDPLREFIREEDVYYAGVASFFDIDEKERILLELQERLPFNFKDCSLRLRKTSENDDSKYKALVHTDIFSSISGVIYLEDIEDEGKKLGTYFWRHVGTGKRRSKTDTFKDSFIDELMLQSDSNDLSCWKCWKSVDLKQNRGVFFPSNYYHSPVPPRVYSGPRFTLDLFFNV